MTFEQSEQMLRICELRYFRVNQSYEVLVAQELRVRDKLTELADLSLVEDDEVHQRFSMAQTGSDLLWNSWAARAKVELNTELARILAHKDAKLLEVSRAHGRYIVAQALANRNNTSVD